MIPLIPSPGKPKTTSTPPSMSVSMRMSAAFGIGCLRVCELWEHGAAPTAPLRASAGRREAHRVAVLRVGVGVVFRRGVELRLAIARIRMERAVLVGPDLERVEADR